jgi:hypothetical protein
MVAFSAERRTVLIQARETFAFRLSLFAFSHADS